MNDNLFCLPIHRPLPPKGAYLPANRWMEKFLLGGVGLFDRDSPTYYRLFPFRL